MPMLCASFSLENKSSSLDRAGIGGSFALPQVGVGHNGALDLAGAPLYNIFDLGGDIGRSGGLCHGRGCERDDSLSHSLLKVIRRGPVCFN